MMEWVAFIDIERKYMGMKRILLICVLVLICLLTSVASADVMITEIMASNGVFIEGENFDWIEIHNTGNETVDLSGYGLSDSKKDRMKWQFPEGAKIRGGDYLVIYCTGEEFKSNANRDEYYTDYKLSQDGENLVLSDPEGNQLDLVKYPQQYGNISYGLLNGEWRFLEEATPGKANAGNGFDTQAERPVIETPAGFYTLDEGETLQVILSGSGEIRYTLDGSEPNRSSALYTQPIEIAKTTVVRARICDPDQLMSVGVGATYFINDPAPVAVVSLSLDDRYLYDDRIGVFVKGNGGTPNYRKNLEHPIHIEYFGTDGVRQIAQNGSFHVHGYTSRAYNQKSIAIYARDVYGDDNRFYFNPFEHRDYDSYKSLLLRAAGSDNKYCRMRDVVFTSATEGLGLMYQDARPILVYINGRYWGQYNLREKVNKHAVAQWEGVTDGDLIDEIDILEGSAEGGRQIQNGSNEDWLALRRFVDENDLNDPAYLQYVTDRLDVESFFTWASVEIVAGNADMENVRIYRVPGGKWKYLLYDVDAGASGRLDAVYKLLAHTHNDSRSSQYGLMQKLLRVPEMKTLFLETMARVIKHCFLYETRMDPIIDEQERMLEILLPRHLERFNDFTMNSWRGNVSAMRYHIRTSPKATIDEVCELLYLSAEEKETYFGEVLSLLEVQNARDKQ